MYNFQCVLMSGAPGTGKDTLSDELCRLDAAFVFFRKHRASVSYGHESNPIYFHVSHAEFNTMQDMGEFVQSHERYGKAYGVSRAECLELVSSGRIPIIHVGRYENLRPLREGISGKTLSLLLWADRPLTEHRLIERHSKRLDGHEERLIAFEEEWEILRKYRQRDGLEFDIVYANNGENPGEAGRQLLSLLREWNPGSLRVDHDFSFLDS